MGGKLLVHATNVATKFLTTTTETTEEVSEGAQKIVDWFNKTNVQATLIVLGISAAIVVVGILAWPKVKKLFK